MQELKQTARNYWLQGLNIVLLKGKKPLQEWKCWQTERQSESDFEALPWNEADGFALVGGSKLDNGLFFAAEKTVESETRQRLVEFAWWMKKRGYADETIRCNVSALKILKKEEQTYTRLNQ